MNPDTPKTALDDLLTRVPTLNPEVFKKAKEMGEMLRKLGLLSTEPVEVYVPFNRKLFPTPPKSGTMTWSDR